MQKDKLKRVISRCLKDPKYSAQFSLELLREPSLVVSVVELITNFKKEEQDIFARFLTKKINFQGFFGYQNLLYSLSLAEGITQELKSTAISQYYRISPEARSDQKAVTIINLEAHSKAHKSEWLASIFSKTKKPRIGFLGTKFSARFVSSNEYIRLLIAESSKDICPYILATVDHEDSGDYKKNYPYFHVKTANELNHIVKSNALSAVVDLTQEFRSDFVAATSCLWLDIWDQIIVLDNRVDSRLCTKLYRFFDYASFGNTIYTNQSNFCYPVHNRTYPDIEINQNAINNKSLVFGAFCRPGKLSVNVIELWSKLLRFYPNSIIRFSFIGGNSDTSLCYHLIQVFKKFGVTPERIEILPYSNTYNYLQRINEITLMLGSAPECGGISLLDAAAMGKPSFTPDYLLNTYPFEGHPIVHNFCNFSQSEDEFLGSIENCIDNLCSYSEQKGTEMRSQLFSSSITDITQAWSICFTYILKSINMNLS